VSLRPQREFVCDASDDKIIVASPELQVTFTKSGNSWTHRVELAGATLVEVARVLESDPERNDPMRIVSPVYQEIHRHDASPKEGCCLLLTGRLFQHHFSAVFRLHAPDGAQGAVVAEFDVADRCRAPVACLAATYLVMRPTGAIADADRTRIAWNVGIDDDESQLELGAHPPCTLALAEAGRQATRVQALAVLSTESFTHRFCYRWRRASVVGRTR
jgi:hypothetical protein